MTPPSLSKPPRTAWISGASAGLGASLARSLLAHGVRVWGTSRDERRLVGFGGTGIFRPVCMDLLDTDASAAAFSAAEHEAGGFDLVVHSAGFGVFAPFLSVPAETWLEQVRAMVSSLVVLNHASLRSMRARGSGTLVNVSSVAVEYPLPYMAGYNVSKAALSALSESLMFETRGTALCVIDFRPADLRTDFNRAMRLPTAVDDAAVQAAWRTLERNLASAPAPERAVADLFRAVDRGRSGTVYSGGFFQARVAPLFSRIAPARLKRAVAARYFGVS